MYYDILEMDFFRSSKYSKMEKNKIKNRHVIFFLFILMFISCKRGDMKNTDINFPKLKEIPHEKWQELSKKKIFFGHQSVGFNIIDGLADILEFVPDIKLNIKSTISVNDFDVPVFAHSAIGKNSEPITKCMKFKEIMESGVGDKINIAFFKFCYVDIKQETDIKEVFNTYKHYLDKLTEQYKNIVFIHVTVPLRVIQTGPKAWVKKIIGRPLTGILKNVKRNQFNTMLRKEYKGKAFIFDLARIESTFPDGKRNKFKYGKKIYYSLIHKYSNDGGHLNKFGRIKVAEQLLIFLSQL